MHHLRYHYAVLARSDQSGKHLGTERDTWWNRPAGTHLGHPRKCGQSSSNLVRQSNRHLVRGIHHGVWETVDPGLHSSHVVGEHRRSSEGTAGHTGDKGSLTW